jgi:hypothetical protein
MCLKTKGDELTYTSNKIDLGGWGVSMPPTCCDVFAKYVGWSYVPFEPDLALTFSISR